MPLGEGGLYERGRERGAPHLKALFYHYWLVYRENGCR